MMPLSLSGRGLSLRWTMYRCLFRSLPVLMLLTVLSLVPALSGDACREMTSLVGPTCALADEAPQKNDDKADSKKDDKAQDKKAASSAPAEADAAPTVDPLENIWAGQKDMLDDINSSTRGLVRDINKQAETMSKQARPIVEEARRLLLLINTFKNWPNPLEALDRRGILGGLPLGDDRVLWCATEKVSRAQLDKAVSIVKEVLAK